MKNWLIGTVVVALVTATIVTPALLASLWLPFVAMASVCGLIAVWLLWRHRAAVGNAGAVPMKNPFSLLAAGKFALLFAVVQLLLKLGQEYLPQSGIYAVAALAGLTDVDAVTLSMAERARLLPADAGLAVVAIAVASASNTVVKAGMAAGMGRHLGRFVVPATVSVLVVGLVVLLIG